MQLRKHTLLLHRFIPPVNEYKMFHGYGKSKKGTCVEITYIKYEKLHRQRNLNITGEYNTYDINIIGVGNC